MALKFREKLLNLIIFVSRIEPRVKCSFCVHMSPVFTVFYTVTRVSWSQKHVQNDNIHSIILDVYVFKVWRLKIPFSVEPCKLIKYYQKGGLVLLVL